MGSRGGTLRVDRKHLAFIKSFEILGSWEQRLPITDSASPAISDACSVLLGVSEGAINSPHHKV